MKTTTTMLALGLACLCGCEVDELVPPAELPVSENGVYTDDGRFFVVGEDTVYEIEATADGYAARTIFHDPGCYLGGLTDDGNVLYAPCDRNEAGLPPELLRLEPTVSGPANVSRAAFPPFAGDTLLNGMDMGPDGALYISNSQALLTGDAAILRVTIQDLAPLAFEVEPFLPATAFSNLGQDTGGLFPNGLHFDGNTLYFSRGLDVVRMTLIPAGGLGPMQVIYRTGSLAVIDDFDLYDGKLFMAYTDLLGAALPQASTNKLVVVETDGTFVYEMPLPVAPSSTAVRPNTLFGDMSVVITSFFHGGLYRATLP